MKTGLIAMLALGFLAVGCGETDGTGPTDTTDTTEETTTQQAALIGALPADGTTVYGEFHLAAVLDSEIEVDAEFFLDGQSIAVVDSAPYVLTMSACDLTPGNHHYVVEITNAGGERSFEEQWFEAAPCD